MVKLDETIIIKNVLLLIIVFILYFSVSSIITLFFTLDVTSLQTDQANGHYYLELFDPIFFSYGFSYYDIQKLDLSYNKYADCSDYRIDFYPDNFYKRLGDTNSLYIKYYNNPNHESGHDLISMQKETALAYIDDNERFLKSLMDIDQESVFLLPNKKTLTMTDMRAYFRQNIENGYFILEELQLRQKHLHENPEYDFFSSPSVSLDMTDSIDKTYLLDETQALEMLQIYVLSSKDDISTHKKVDKYTPDDLFVAKIPLACEDGAQTNVYGIDDNFYANMFYGNYDGDINLLIDYEYRGEMYMPFAACNCPYVEEDRVNWYVIKHIYDDIEKKGYTKFEDYEKKFVQEPTYNNMQLLSDVYEKELKENFVMDTIDNKEHLIMWKRMNKINTKFFIIDELMDDFNSKESSAYFNVEAASVCEEYQNYVIVESMFHLTFMRWSNAVFRIESELPFGETADVDITKTVIINQSNKDFMNTILENKI